jgi:ankyrin repeat protein
MEEDVNQKTSLDAAAVSGNKDILELFQRNK